MMGEVFVSECCHSSGTPLTLDEDPHDEMMTCDRCGEKVLRLLGERALLISVWRIAEALEKIVSWTEDGID